MVENENRELSGTTRLLQKSEAAIETIRSQKWRNNAISFNLPGENGSVVAWH